MAESELIERLRFEIFGCRTRYSEDFERLRTRRAAEFLLREAMTVTTNMRIAAHIANDLGEDIPAIYRDMLRQFAREHGLSIGEDEG